MRRSLLLLIVVVATLNGAKSASNITEILADDPSYSSFNQYLTDTKLTDEINSRTTITVLALNNVAISALTANHPLSFVKSVLSLLDYYDPSKLHGISNGTTLTGFRDPFLFRPTPATLSSSSASLSSTTGNGIYVSLMAAAVVVPLAR